MSLRYFLRRTTHYSRRFLALSKIWQISNIERCSRFCLIFHRRIRVGREPFDRAKPFPNLVCESSAMASTFLSPTVRATPIKIKLTARPRDVTERPFFFEKDERRPRYRSTSLAANKERSVEIKGRIGEILFILFLFFSSQIKTISSARYFNSLAWKFVKETIKRKKKNRVIKFLDFLSNEIWKGTRWKRNGKYRAGIITYEHLVFLFRFGQCR